jgi:hypothetical protein
MPFMPYVTGDLKIHPDKVVIETIPEQSLIDAYKQHFSPVVTPPASGIVVPFDKRK